MTPSSFIHAVNSGAMTEGCLPELKCCVLSGETMPWLPLKKWMRAAPNADWWHFYGSTEMFCVASARVDGGRKPDGLLPVGRPFPMTHILILDENGAEASPGEIGEICVSSPWVSCGYYRDPALTAASWVSDPLKKGWRETFHRSGDLGCMTSQGELIVIGRRDSQIKHAGYRMELADVERGLQAVEEVKESCVLYDKETGRIFCFYVSDLDEKALNKALKERLQPYMLPDVYVRLDQMPHTASMKIARKVLIEMIPNVRADSL